MKTKKNPKYDLEKRRKLYFNLGLLIAGSATLAAFRWGTPVEEPVDNVQYERELPVEVIEFVKVVELQPQTSFQAPRIDVFVPEEAEEVEEEIEEPTDDKTIVNIPPPEIKGPIGQGTIGVSTHGDPQTFESQDVEDLPEYPGGDMAMMSFIQKGYKFPKHQDLTDQGTIYVRFVVTSKGEITEVSIARGISPEMDREAMRVVQSMPNWKPGKYRGRPVNVRMVIPIKIKYT